MRMVEACLPAYSQSQVKLVDLGQIRFVESVLEFIVNPDSDLVKKVHSAADSQVEWPFY